MDDQVWVAILLQKRGEGRHPLADIAAEENAAARDYIFGHQQIDVTEIVAEQQPAPEPADSDAAVSGVIPEDVVIAARIIKFRRQAFHYGVNVRLFAEVDPRPCDFRRDARFRRDILDEQARKTFL